MKTLIFFISFIVHTCSLFSQSHVTNTGIIYMSGNTDTFFVTGNFTNNATADLVNNGNVYDSGNVSNAQPTDLSGSGIISLTGNINQSVTAVAAFNNLQLNKTAGSAVLSTDVRINGNLHFISGKIVTGANTIIIPSSGIVSGASQSAGWIHGNLQKALSTGNVTKIFETGDALIYAPVQLSFPNITVAGNVRASTTGIDHPNINISIINPAKSVNRYWSITNLGTSFNSYTAVFNFNSTDVDAGANPSVFGVGLFDGTNWSMLGTSFRNATNIRAAGFNSFGSFAIGETFVVVPVTFTDITAFRIHQEIAVKWHVENEMNVLYFEIERSGNGVLFEKIDMVAANGNGSYQIIDKKPLVGNNYYRIRSFDGQRIAGSSRIVNVRMDAMQSLLVYPNPVTGSYATLQLRNIPAGFYKIQLFNSSGMQVKSLYLNHPGGTSDHTVTLDNNFAPGKYEILLTGSAIRMSTSLIKN